MDNDGNPTTIPFYFTPSHFATLQSLVTVFVEVNNGVVSPEDRSALVSLNEAMERSLATHKESRTDLDAELAALLGGE